MAYFVYIIYSVKLDCYYVGQTDDISDRLLQHNSGISKYTSKANDWCLKHCEEFATRKEAMEREHAIKKKKSRKYIEWLVNSAN